MTRAFWFIGEVVVGILASGALAAIAAPLLVRAGREPGPAAVWLTLAVSIVLCVVIGERLRKGRNRHRLS
jgi:predicted PurR-regulated permease PerM